MRYSLYILFVFLLSCGNNNNKQEVVKSEIDTLIEKSVKISDSSVLVLKLADKRTEILIEEVEKKIDNLENVNESLKNSVFALKNQSNSVKTITIRDTIYITEKKNFWGKTKRTIDSSQSVSEDSLQHK